MEGSGSQDLTFGDAVGELEEILGRIEGDETDIDELATELKKATQLLELCRDKIRKAEIEVTQIVQSLDTDSDAEGEGQEEDT